MTAASSSNTSIFVVEDHLPPMLPHLLSFGFDWNMGIVDRAATTREEVDCTPIINKEFHQRGVPLASVRQGGLHAYHTSLRFTRPVDHPLHQRKTYHQTRASFLKKCQLERIASNKTWASDDSICVSSLGIGGWDEVDDDEHDCASAQVFRSSLNDQPLPAEAWTIMVDDDRSDHDSPWFKLTNSGADAILWLEGDEIFSFFDCMDSTRASICIHLVQDDVTAIVPIAEARDFFATMLFAPSLTEHNGYPSPASSSNPFLMSRLLKFGQFKQRQTMDLSS
ncbi:hypothetical protein MPSEU_000084700 [Mayamaea pseudoterrestris]|nr:hypothetical protein MPSEU_000084700 [Mayamaea pseudoterrestris]